MNQELKRITVQVEPELYTRLNRVVQHGFRRHLMAGLIKLALDAIEERGEVMIGALVAGKFKLVWDEEDSPKIGTV